MKSNDKSANYDFCVCVCVFLHFRFWTQNAKMALNIRYCFQTFNKFFPFQRAYNLFYAWERIRHDRILYSNGRSYLRIGLVDFWETFGIFCPYHRPFKPLVGLYLTLSPKTAIGVIVLLQIWLLKIKRKIFI